jgi:RNA polymerase sigma-70 factor (ECF subfamily)
MNTASAKKEFLKLIEDNKGIIFKICNSYCANVNDREDLAQDIIYQLWRSGKRFSNDHKFTTWMYRVALNTAISFYRKEKNKEGKIPLFESVYELPDRAESTSTTEENILLLQQLINELKELDRALMILYLEDKSYKDIADILGITETNVATRISRIKETLKQKFSKINNH